MSTVMNEHPNHFLWTEKYRPSKLTDLILEDDQKKIIDGFLNDKEIPHLLLSGSAGVGKTTMVKVLCNELNMDYLFVNASLESNLDLLRDKVSQFARTKTALGKSKKIILLDEADGVRSAGFWDALRPIIEQFSNNCRFVLTCNMKDRIPEPIASRLIQIDFFISDKKSYAGKVMAKLEFILKNEGIKYDRKIVAEIIKAKFPDIRSMIQLIQQYKDSLTDENMKYRYSGKDVSKLLTSMKDKNFQQMREIILNDYDSTEFVYRDIYDGMKDFIDPSTVPNAILVLDDYMRSHFQVVDKEIHIIAFCIEFTKNVKFKEK